MQEPFVMGQRLLEIFDVPIFRQPRPPYSVPLRSTPLRVRNPAIILSESAKEKSVLIAGRFEKKVVENVTLRMREQFLLH